MDNNKMREILQKRLTHPERIFKYDRKNSELRIEHIHTTKGMTISLPGIIAKWHNQKDKAIDEIVYYVEESLKALEKDPVISEKDHTIYPVIRSTSFPVETNEGIPFIFDDHTAETRIYYALDLGNTYRLLDKNLVTKEKWDVKHLKEMALFNVRSLSTKMKTDVVADNVFYFINSNDGYDASRILNESLLKDMSQKIKGTMTISVPHQDVLIIGDIQNEVGYDILAQMAMNFFASGRVPITALSFLYEDGELEPIFILGNNRKK